MLDISHVSKTYDGRPPVRALQDISLETNDAAFITIVGPSGCGKSTLLRCIAGIEPITSGAIRLNGVDLADVPVGQRRVEWLPQRVGATFLPAQSIRRNLTLGFRLAGRPPPENQILEEAARALGIQHILDKRPRETSGGELQRAALARAMLSQPDIFLLDEPLTSLDDARRRELKEQLVDFRARAKATFIYVTHDHSEALSLGDLCVVMRDGQIAQSGAPAEVFGAPKTMFVAEFLSPSGLNKIRGASLTGAQGNVDAKWLCFRPESVVFGATELPTDAIDLGAGQLQSSAFEGVQWRACYSLTNRGGAIINVITRKPPPPTPETLRVERSGAFFFESDT